MTVTGTRNPENPQLPGGRFRPEDQAVYTAKRKAPTGTTGLAHSVLGTRVVGDRPTPADPADVLDGPHPACSIDTPTPRPCRSHRNPEDDPCP